MPSMRRVSRSRLLHATLLLGPLLAIACSGDDEPEPEQTPECQQDRDCSPGERCVMGVCLPGGRPGISPFPNVSMDPDAERYVERVVNDERIGSSLIRVIDQLLQGEPVPDPQTGVDPQARAEIRDSAPGSGRSAAPERRATRGRGHRRAPPRRRSPRLRPAA